MATSYLSKYFSFAFFHNSLKAIQFENWHEILTLMYFLQKFEVLNSAWKRLWNDYFLIQSGSVTHK